MILVKIISLIVLFVLVIGLLLWKLRKAGRRLSNYLNFRHHPLSLQTISKEEMKQLMTTVQSLSVEEKINLLQGLVDTELKISLTVDSYGTVSIGSIKPFFTAEPPEREE